MTITAFPWELVSCIVDFCTTVESLGLVLISLVNLIFAGSKVNTTRAKAIALFGLPIHILTLESGGRFNNGGENLTEESVIESLGIVGCGVSAGTLIPRSEVTGGSSPPAELPICISVVRKSTPEEGEDETDVTENEANSKEPCGLASVGEAAMTMTIFPCELAVIRSVFSTTVERLGLVVILSFILIFE